MFAPLVDRAFPSGLNRRGSGTAPAQPWVRRSRARLAGTWAAARRKPRVVDGALQARKAEVLQQEARLNSTDLTRLQLVALSLHHEISSPNPAGSGST